MITGIIVDSFDSLLWSCLSIRPPRCLHSFNLLIGHFLKSAWLPCFYCFLIEIHIWLLSGLCPLEIFPLFEGCHCISKILLSFTNSAISFWSFLMCFILHWIAYLIKHCINCKLFFWFLSLSLEVYKNESFPLSETDFYHSENLFAFKYIFDFYCATIAATKQFFSYLVLEQLCACLGPKEELYIFCIIWLVPPRSSWSFLKT